jgi:hypothetical protein
MIYSSCILFGTWFTEISVEVGRMQMKVNVSGTGNCKNGVTFISTAAVFLLTR